MKITITEKEHKEVIDLYERAQKTPVIALSMADGLSGRDFATLAWNRARDYMEMLGKKYKYSPSTAKISKDNRTFEAQEV